jgi:REP-associated tyrosine transposase
VLNPVRARICAHPRDWRWSSYRATAGLEPTTEALSSEMLLATLDPDHEKARQRWISFVDAAVETGGPDPAPWTAVSD